MSGKLHLETPLAEPCYPGSAYNEEACASIDANLKDQVFIEQTTIGLSYPTESCPPVNALAGLITGTCSLGDQPVYTVNATEVDDVVKTIKYARQKNIRLVVRNTGHDILRRSTGYGSLQIWIHYLKTGISFQSTYAGSCTKSGWTGSAVSIGGGYTWEDVYPLAAANNVVVVGGGSPVSTVPIQRLGKWLTNSSRWAAWEAGCKGAVIALLPTTSAWAPTKSLKPRSVQSRRKLMFIAHQHQ